ncbi:hypothetical protein MTO96_008055 [Rhipicephalus appendiculatus]
MAIATTYPTTHAAALTCPRCLCFPGGPLVRPLVTASTGRGADVAKFTEGPPQVVVLGAGSLSEANSRCEVLLSILGFMDFLDFTEPLCFLKIDERFAGGSTVLARMLPSSVVISAFGKGFRKQGPATSRREG